ncbi:MAG: DUF11 domain-containing protein [Anaerolineae bacterium]|nr:DUF11 domain-containing protein [Anaerolineae bacterium]
MNKIRKCDAIFKSALALVMILAWLISPAEIEIGQVDAAPPQDTFAFQASLPRLAFSRAQVPQNARLPSLVADVDVAGDAPTDLMFQTSSGLTVRVFAQTGSGDNNIVFNGKRITYTVVLSNSGAGAVAISDVILANELPKDAWGQVQVDEVACVEECILDYDTREVLTPLGNSVEVTVTTKVSWDLGERDGSDLVLAPGEQIVRTFSGRVTGQPDGTIIGNDAYVLYTLGGNIKFDFSARVYTTVRVRSTGNGVAGVSDAPTWLSVDLGGTIGLDWGDFDHDGDLDLALGSTSGTTVYQNEGGYLTRFWGNTHYALGVRWVDVLEGGNLELIVVGESISNSAVTSGTNYIYSVNSDGSATSSSFTSEYQLLRVEVGDFDNDGQVDMIASTNAIDAACPVRMFKNNSGAFDDIGRCVSIYATANLALGDYDNDGLLDVILGQFPNKVVLLVDVGQALVSPPSALTQLTVDDSTTFLPYDFAWGDYDGDGYLDLAAAFPMDRRVRIYHNEGGSAFSFDPNLEFRTDLFYTPLALDWADFNLDGHLDLVVADSPPVVYLNSGGAGTPFSASNVVDFPIDAIDGQIWSIAAADQDNDGDLDLALGNRDGASVLFTTFAPLLAGKLSAVGSSWAANSVAWGDVDGDGALDLFFGAGGQSLRSGVYRNAGNGTFEGSPQWTYAYGPVANVSFANVNRDSGGKLELAVGTASGVQVYYDGQLSVAPWQPAVALSANCLAWGDVEGDGDLDLLVGSNGAIALYLNQGSALAASPVWTSSQTDDTRSIAWGDYDQDGYLDFAAGNYGQPVRIYRNTGAQAFVLAWSFTSLVSNTTSVAWADFNGDGYLDLTVGNYGAPNLIYANQNGSFSQTPAWVSVEYSKTMSLAWGDWDGDGDLDLAVGNDGEADQVYANRSVGTGIIQLDWVWRSDEVLETTGVAWGDMDGDGDLDLAISQRNMLNRNGVYINHHWTPSHLASVFTPTMPLLNNPPYVALTRPGTTKSAYFYSSHELLSGSVQPTITIQYELYDPDETRRGVDLGHISEIYTTLYEYSADGGGTWRTATPAVTPTASVTVGRSGRVLTFEWDAISDQVFSDNVLFRVTAIYLDPAGSVQHASTSSVSPPFRVRATDECVWPEHPTITTFPENPQPGETVVLMGTISQGSGVLTFNWNLGDGTVRQGQSISHIYAYPNTYNVSLSVKTQPCPVVRIVTATKQLVVGSGVPNIYLPLVLKAAQSGASSVAVREVVDDSAIAKPPISSVDGGHIYELASSGMMRPAFGSLTAQADDVAATFLADTAVYSSCVAPCSLFTVTGDIAGIYSQPSINGTGKRIAFWSTGNLGGNRSRFNYYLVPTVLLVDDDDNYPDVRAYYQGALDALGITYDVWDTHNSDYEPNAADLARSLGVVWFTGDEYGGYAGPGSSGEAALSSFLSSGSRCLFISSQDYHYDRGLTGFMSAYLGVGSVQGDRSISSVTGVGSFAGLGTRSLAYPVLNYSDWIFPSGTAQQAFLGWGYDYLDSSWKWNPAAVAKISSYRTTFWAFPFEALPTPEVRSQAMANVIAFCGSGNVIVPTIVINEVDLGRPEGEAIELYNHGGQTINMTGWQLNISHNGGSINYALPSAFSLAPGDYIIVHESTGINTAHDLYLGQNVDWVPGSGGAVGLLDAYGRGVDFVRWDSSMIAPPLGAIWQGSNPGTIVVGVDDTLGRGDDTNSGQDWCIRPGTLKSKNLGCDSGANNADGNIEVFLAELGVSSLITQTYEVTFTQMTSSTGSILGGFNLWPSMNYTGTRLVLFSDRDLEYNPLVGTQSRNADQNFEIFMYDELAAGNPFVQLVDSKEGVSLYPSINADGTRVVFASDRNLHNNPALPGRSNSEGLQEIFVAEVSASAITITQITESLDRESNDQPVISGDGNYVALARFKQDGTSEIQLWYIQDANNPTLSATFSSGSINIQPTIDQNGTHIAFVSNRTLSSDNADGNQEIFLVVRDVSGFTFTQVTSTAGNLVNEQPSISGDGYRVAYVNNDGIWFYDVGERVRMRLAGKGDSNSRPSISANGLNVAFAADQKIYWAEFPLVDLAIAKTSTPLPLIAGAPVTYLITVTNLGPSDVFGALVSDTLPTELLPQGSDPYPSWQCIPSSGALCTASGSGWVLTDLITLSAESYVTYIITGRLDSSASANVVNVATVTAPPGAVEHILENNQATDQQSPTTEADLAVAKVASSDTVIAGTILTYTITYTNTEPSDSRDVFITDTLPAGTVFRGVVSPGLLPVVNGQQLVWSRPTLGAQVADTVVFTVTVSPWATGELVNRVEISSIVPDPVLGNNSDTMTTTVVTLADLEVSKLDAPDPVVAGDVLTYTLIYTNHGPSYARQVTITDSLPISVTWGGVRSSSVVTREESLSSGWVRWVTPSLAAGASGTIVFTVTVTDSLVLPGEITNWVTITSQTTDPGPNANDESINTTVVLQTDLRVTKSASTNVVAPGEPVTYTIVVTNASATVRVVDATTSDTLPGGLFQGLAWTCQPSPGSSCGLTSGFGSLAHSIERLEPGGTVTYIVIGNVVPSTTLSSVSNTADIAVPGGYVDSNLSNNQASVRVSLVPQADLSVRKLDSPDPVLAGTVLTYTLIHTNTGPSYARSITLTDRLTTGVTFGGMLPGSAAPSSITPSPDGQVVEWTWSELAVDAVVTTRFTVTVNASVPDGSILVNTATITSRVGDSDAGDNQMSITTAVQARADLTINKSIQGVTAAGETLTYTISYANAGPSLAREVYITDTLPLSVTWGGVVNQGIANRVENLVAGWVRWYTPSLSPGAAGQIVFTVTVANDLLAQTRITNTARMSSDTTDPNLPNETVLGTDVGVKVDVALRKTVNTTAPFISDLITYTIVVSNEHTATATGVVVNDALPAGLIFVNAAATAGSYNSGNGDWNIGTLNAGAQVTLTLVASVTGSSAIVNVAEVIAVTEPDWDSTPNNHLLSEDDQDEVTINPINRAPQITEGAEITVTMSEDGSPIAFGLTLHATDADGHTITWSISSAAGHGTATASGTGTSRAIGYTPDANYNGMDSFVVQVSDGLTGTDTIVVDVVITPENDAPVLNASFSPTLTTIISTALPLTNTADTVAGIVVDGSISDVDGVAVKAIAIVAADGCGIGDWQYSLDGGLNWTAVAPVSVSSALLLGPTDRVRFNPTGSGSCAFTFRAWDQSSGVAGNKVDTTSAGGTTPYSSSTDTASITIE